MRQVFFFGVGLHSGGISIHLHYEASEHSIIAIKMQELL